MSSTLPRIYLLTSVSNRALLCLLLIFVLCLTGCTSDQNSLFEQRSSAETGVTFTNSILENDSLLNPIDFDYVYNGGGVAVGDLSGNDRPDLHFAGNTVDNRLYLNLGNFQFKDITEHAGVQASEAWSTGVTLVDINQDGLMDIYVCVGGPPALAESRANKLYVNQGLGADGVPIFKQQAAAYGVADSSYSTHAAFFDYDRDGDLDLYVLNNAMEDRGQTSITRKQTNGEAPSTDRLYRNNAPRNPPRKGLLNLQMFPNRRAFKSREMALASPSATLIRTAGRTCTLQTTSSQMIFFTSTRGTAPSRTALSST